MNQYTRVELNELSEQIHKNVVDRGYWDTPTALNSRENAALTVLSKVALIHSELSEAVEAVRKTPEAKWGSMDDHSVVRELAGTMVRIIDLAKWLHVDLWKALEIEVQYNEDRPKNEGRAA